MFSLIARKIYRCLAVIFPIVYYFTDKSTILTILTIFLIFLLILEFLRYKFAELNEKIFKIAKIFLKEKEKRRISATTVVVFSILLTIILFRKSIAIYSVLFLIFSDGVSAIIGTKFGKIKIFRGKTLEGSLSFLITCLFIGILFYPTAISLPFRKIFAGALTATFAELLPLDDNLTIPLASGLIMWLIP